MELGSWREVTPTGITALKRSLLSASDKTYASLDDTENLKTGIKHDEYIVGMPKSWVKSGNNFLNFLTHLFQVTTSANPSIRGFLPKDLFDLSPLDLPKLYICGSRQWRYTMKVSDEQINK